MIIPVPGERLLYWISRRNGLPLVGIGVQWRFNPRCSVQGLSQLSCFYARFWLLISASRAVIVFQRRSSPFFVLDIDATVLAIIGSAEAERSHQRNYQPPCPTGHNDDMGWSCRIEDASFYNSRRLMGHVLWIFWCSWESLAQRHILAGRKRLLALIALAALHRNHKPE